MTGIDTTVLVTYEIAEAPAHTLVRDHIIGESRSGTANYALCPQVLQEFVHVATDSRRFLNPLSMEDALLRSRFWWESADVTQCHPGSKTWEQAWTWMSEFRLGRKRILDTYLAATYLEAGIRKIATSNRDDFAIFGVFEFESWAEKRNN